MIEMPKEMKMWNVDQLIPYERNSRKHSSEQIERIAQSINQFGFTNPILVDGTNGIIAGHGRLMAAKKLGLSEVPVIQLDHLTEQQKRAYIIADNRLAELSEWDDEILKSELFKLQEFGFDLELTGFDNDMLAEIMPPEKSEPLTDEDAVPEVEDVPVVKRGDTWILGNHRLRCGDSTSAEDVAILLDGKKMDLVITDPPYNVAVNDESDESLKARNRRKDGLTIQNDKMSENEFIEFLKSIFIRYFNALKDGGSIYVFYADSMTIPFMSTFIESGFHFAQNCIWNKQQFVMTRKDYHYKHEPVMYGWKKGAAHNWYTDRKQSSVWSFDRPFRNELHPTMKPIDLIEYPLCNSSKHGDDVLDLFGGSGSTLIACEKTGRKCFMMELDEKYVQVIIRRWQDYTGKDAYHAETGETFNSLAAK